MHILTLVDIVTSDDFIMSSNKYNSKLKGGQDNMCKFGKLYVVVVVNMEHHFSINNLTTTTTT